MKTKRLFFASLLMFFLIAFLAHAAGDIQYNLYRISPGAELSDLEVRYGAPVARLPFEDGWVAFVYKFHDHNLVVETAPDDPSYIVTVQIEGKKNPDEYGFMGINLGDNSSSIFNNFGKPLEIKLAKDAISEEFLTDTIFIGYNYFSFEVKGDVITSMKVRFSPREKRDFQEPNGTQI